MGATQPRPPRAVERDGAGACERLARRIDRADATRFGASRPRRRRPRQQSVAGAQNAGAALPGRASYIPSFRSTGNVPASSRRLRPKSRADIGPHGDRKRPHARRHLRRRRVHRARVRPTGADDVARRRLGRDAAPVAGGRAGHHDRSRIPARARDKMAEQTNRHCGDRLVAQYEWRGRGTAARRLLGRRRGTPETARDPSLRIIAVRNGATLEPGDYEAARDHSFSKR